jgi:hypothetical protein
MPDRPFPFRALGAKLQPMSPPRSAPAILVLVCVLATIALTLLFVAVPELSDGAGNGKLWLAT